MSPSARIRRVLAVDPTSRGFGFVVLEGEAKLLDWGVRQIRENKDEMTLIKVQELIQLYRPHVLVAEDCDDPSSRRAPRIAALIRACLRLAVGLRVEPRPVTAARAKAMFAKEGATSKHRVAEAIVRRFPELTSYRPPRRKPWMSEDERQAVFDAMALCVGGDGLCAGQTSDLSRSLGRLSPYSQSAVGVDQ